MVIKSFYVVQVTKFHHHLSGGLNRILRISPCKEIFLLLFFLFAQLFSEIFGVYEYLLIWASELNTEFLLKIPLFICLAIQ